ncbi:60S ribosomal protein L14 [Tyrophagus putrescentiae]|nr:60S ribosomal protein L14 [Tyrophagus putrescentiae]
MAQSASAPPTDDQKAAAAEEAKQQRQQQMPFGNAIQFKRLRLTKFRLDIPHGTSSEVVKKAHAAQEIDSKFAFTPLAIRLKQRSLKAAMTDFDRFKLYKAKQQYNRIVNTKLALLKSKGKTALKAKQNANKKTKSKK